MYNKGKILKGKWTIEPTKVVNGFLLGVMILTAVAACSTKPSLPLTDVEVDISSNRDLTGTISLQEGEEAGKEVVMTALTYIFRLENTGKRQMGKESEMIDAMIVANESLRTASQIVMGLNVFEPYENGESGWDSVIPLAVKSNRKMRGRMCLLTI